MSSIPESPAGARGAVDLTSLSGAGGAGANAVANTGSFSRTSSTGFDHEPSARCLASSDSGSSAARRPSVFAADRAK